MLGKCRFLMRKYSNFLKKAPIIHLKSFSVIKINFSFSSQSADKQDPFLSQNFLSGENAQFMESQFNQWLKDKSSVSQSLSEYFSDFIYTVYKNPQQSIFTAPTLQTAASPMEREVCTQAQNDMSFLIKINSILSSYQVLGCEKADLDPLCLELEEAQMGKHYAHPAAKQLDISYFGFSEQDLDKRFNLYSDRHKGFLGMKKDWTLREFIDVLKRTYTGKIGYEFRHIPDHDIQNFFKEKIEFEKKMERTKEQKLSTFKRLCRTHCFSKFFGSKFKTAKRFGVEGCDSIISGLGALVRKAGQNKMEHIIVGMPHRGRLEVLHSIFKKPSSEMSGEFQEIMPGQAIKKDMQEWGNSGDVKYHLGTTYDKEIDGHIIRLQILANPSHLEAVNPLVYGKVRSIQDYTQDIEQNNSMGILFHGDAAFAGQGVVYETLQLQDLFKYKPGGTIHIIANNQIGFTTTPKESRSELFCTDVAKTINAPIIHVNGDDPDSVDHVMELAFEFRQKDIVIDVIGYRRYGHNELDQPGFTQPLMYKKIAETKDVFQKYSDQLIQEGIITLEAKQASMKKLMDEHEEGYSLSKSMESELQRQTWMNLPWEKHNIALLFGKVKDTGIDIHTLRTLGQRINKLKENFNVHPTIQKVYHQRLETINTGKGLDWATAESLAFASLLYEGYRVRLSGQDVERGTFSHRHAVINDQKQSDKFLPLTNILLPGEQHKLSICNSSLSELGVLGFEYGYTIGNPNCLVMWEAQFGDFANGAQVIIDNFLTSGEAKWGVPTGLTMLLPHGMDGQGPEHSSARMERYLQLSGDNIETNMGKWRNEGDRISRQMFNTNVIICSPTTASNYFHMLRRQMRRDYRKPLIAFISKKLLRYKGACSDLSKFKTGLRFKRVIAEAFEYELNTPEDLTKVLICSGQVYYDLLERRRALKNQSIAIVRIEQVAPFPYTYLANALQKYKNAQFFWVQEEHQNYGPWNFIQPRLAQVLSKMQKENLIKHNDVNYVGRKPSNSSAAGSAKIHKMELEMLLSESFQNTT